MIQVLMERRNERILIVIEGNSVRFGNTSFGAKLATIDGLKLNREGVILEHPDLAKSESWKEEAINRFNEKIKSLGSENQIFLYLVNDLKKHGYKAISKQIKGRRPELLNDPL